ncbi:MAG: DUF2304 family protein [Candidatus Gracilibacteria bacterium]|nr:DUF2304 family protein [Candidatus Gracilibacteria bacterium]
MNLLQLFFIISGIILFIISIDVAKKQKFNALHFLVFIGVGAGLVIFTFFPNALNTFGGFFGLQRGADLLVYSSIIFLMYFSVLLLNKVEENKSDITKLVREIAITNSKKEIISGEICFVIAVYNEEKVIKNTILNLLDYGYKNIILINDGSKDNTLNELKDFKDQIVILTHYKNRGQGAALETGFEYLRRYGETKYVCTFDADGQHQLKDLHKFLNAFKDDNSLQIVLGSRFITKTNTNVNLSRKIILKLGILFTFFISSIKLTDSHNGYRVMKIETLKDISITIDGMGHASEIVDIIATKKLKFKEIPVDILYTDYTLSKGQSSLNAINIALKTIWYKFFK